MNFQNLESPDAGRAERSLRHRNTLGPFLPLRVLRILLRPWEREKVAASRMRVVREKLCRKMGGEFPEAFRALNP